VLLAVALVSSSSLVRAEEGEELLADQDVVAVDDAEDGGEWANDVEDDAGVAEDFLEAELLSDEQMKELHTLMDKNGDGQVTEEEVLQVNDEMRQAMTKREVQTFLEDLDANRDGTLSLAEVLQDVDGDADSADLQAYREAERKKFEASDKNHDGVLDRDELPAMFELSDDQNMEQSTRALLQEKDRDGDGLLSMSEFVTNDNDKADFEMVDVDKNGVLSAQELKDWQSGRLHARQALKELFRVADANGDQKLTVEELAGARAQIAETEAQYHLAEWLDVTHEL